MDRALSVGWTPGFDGGRPITSYSIEIKEENREREGAVVAVCQTAAS